MSRTYKDAPYLVRRVRENKKKFRSEFWDYSWRGRPRRQIDESYEEWRASYNEWFEKNEEFEREYLNDDRCWHFILTTPPKWFRQSLNQQYRAKTKQMIRQGKEDILPLPKKNANWLWW